jgi:hypothetical protein
MKKVIAGLIMTGFAYCSAQAQTTPVNSCGVKQGKVCRISPDKKNKPCYATKYAENFAVCKNINGYFICCETPNNNNSTLTYFYSVTGRDTKSEEMPDQRDSWSAVVIDKSIPESQSYKNTDLKRDEIKANY